MNCNSLMQHFFVVLNLNKSSITVLKSIFCVVKKDDYRNYQRYQKLI